MRQSPTEKQVTALRELETDALVSKALEAMHALNRRAKEKRDRARKFRGAQFSEAVRDEIESIYSLKNTLLRALVDSGKASLFVFRETLWEWRCFGCERDWGGNDGECRSCGCTGQRLKREVPWSCWYIVEIGEFRFHQPGDSAPRGWAEKAEKVEAHDPTQPQREIPNVGLTIQAQYECVRLAIERLKGNDEIE